jgi:hypothetical protein
MVNGASGGKSVGIRQRGDHPDWFLGRDLHSVPSCREIEAPDHEAKRNLFAAPCRAAIIVAMHVEQINILTDGTISVGDEIRS